MFIPMFNDGRGLGTIVCDESGCYDDGTGNTSIYGTSGTPGAGQEPATGGGPGTPGYTPIPGTPVTAPTNVASIVSSISNAFSSIFKTIQPLPAGCTQVAGPYGVSTQCVGSGTTTSPLSLSMLGSSSSLLLIGGAVLVVVLISSRK
jgi:hypothetical protein